MKLKTVKLKNGSEVLEGVIDAIKSKLSKLIQETYSKSLDLGGHFHSIKVVSELSRKSNDSNYQIGEEAIKKQLVAVGLLNADGSIDASVSNIVCSSLTIHKQEYSIVNPVDLSGTSFFDSVWELFV